MKRTGNSKLAVVGWGRGMGHKGHMYLADAVITQARDMGADPYFFVSKTVGKDDPIYPEEKIQIYQKVFPQQATIFTAQGNLNQALQELAQMGYKGVVVVVGADQKKAFQYLEGNNKEGVPVYQSLGLKKLRVISRQETRSEYAQEEGPRATPMREILLDPNASEEDRFKVWRRDMPDVLGDEMVADLMRKAESRLVQSTTSKDKVKSMSKKIAKIKEAINNYKSKKASVEPLEEARIIDANAKVDLYYVTGSGQRQKIFQAIPQRMLDKAIQVLQSKYPNINPKNIEMRPAGYGEYTRTEDVAEGEGGNYYSIALQMYPHLKQFDRATVITALNNAYEDYLMHYGYEGIGPDEERSMIDRAIKGLKQGVAEAGFTKTPSGDYINQHTGVRSSKPPVKKKRGEKTGAEWDAIEKAKKNKEKGVAEGSEEVDTHGRTKAEWVEAVHAKYPMARVIHNKDNTQVMAVLPNGKEIRWIKDEGIIEQGVKEGSDERKQNALWAQITAHEKAAKQSKDLKRQHHLKMADQLRSQLKTSDNEQGVAEGSDPYADGYNAWKEYLSGKTDRYPKNPYPAGKGMSQWEAGAAKAAEGRDFISGSDQGVAEASFDYTMKDMGDDYAGFASNHSMKHKMLKRIKPEKQQLYKDKINNTRDWDSLFALFKVAKERGDIIEEGVAEAKKANTKTARKEFSKRPRAELSNKEKAKEKADSDAAWERLMAYAAAQKKEDVKEGISLDSLSRFANIIPSFAEKLVKAGFQETQETKQMLQILRLKMQGKASPEQVKWMNKQWKDIVIVALGVGMIGYSTAAAAAHGGMAAAASHGAKDAILHGLADIGLEAAAEVLATKFGIDIVKKLTHGMTTSTGQGHEHEQEKAPQQYGVSPAVAAQNQKNLEKKFQQAKLGFGGMSESVDYLDEK